MYRVTAGEKPASLVAKRVATEGVRKAPEKELPRRCSPVEGLLNPTPIQLFSLLSFPSHLHREGSFGGGEGGRGGGGESFVWTGGSVYDVSPNKSVYSLLTRPWTVPPPPEYALLLLFLSLPSLYRFYPFFCTGPVSPCSHVTCKLKTSRAPH